MVTPTLQMGKLRLRAAVSGGAGTESPHLTCVIVQQSRFTGERGKEGRGGGV